MEMGLSAFDPVEVARFKASRRTAADEVRLARHIHERDPDHVWPHLVFGGTCADSEQRVDHYEAGVEAGRRRRAAQGVSDRPLDDSREEDVLFGLALYETASGLAKEGFFTDAAEYLAELLRLDPTNTDAETLAWNVGLIPYEAGSAAQSLRM